ncbi:MAG: hypothetical protein RL095_2524 [Verrucomicrobiota bacterium]|jgi:hypothetical protein
MSLASQAPLLVAESSFSMDPMLIGAVVCSIALLITTVLRRRSPRRLPSHLILILFYSCGTLVFTGLYLINLHRKEHIHIDHAAALVKAQAQVLCEEIQSRHGRARIAVIHRPGEQHAGLTLEVLRLLAGQGHTVIGLEPASMKEGRDNSYFKGRALERCLQVDADLFVSTCGLPPLDELEELSRFHPELAEGKPEASAPTKPLYVLNGNSSRYLPFLKNGAISGLVIWRSTPDTSVFGFRGQTPRELFSRRYLFVRNDKLEDLPASELAVFAASPAAP